MQASQFEQFKKAAKKENIEIRVDDIPEILQLIKNLQQGSRIEILETADTDNVLVDSAVESSHTDETDKDIDTRSNGLRTLDSLESIASITMKKF